MNKNLENSMLWQLFLSGVLLYLGLKLGILHNNAIAIIATIGATCVACMWSYHRVHIMHSTIALLGVLSVTQFIGFMVYGYTMVPNDIYAMLNIVALIIWFHLLCDSLVDQVSKMRMVQLNKAVISEWLWVSTFGLSVMAICDIDMQILFKFLLILSIFVLTRLEVTRVDKCVGLSAEGN